MRIKRENWIALFGKGGYGRTYWIREHLRHFPKNMCYILDYNVSDYQDFTTEQNVWNVSSGSQKEIEDFLKIPYGKGNCFTVLEEADTYLQYKSPILRRFVLTARNRGVGAFVNCKRAKNISPIYRNRFNYLILFKNSLPDDIKYLEEWCGEADLSILRNLDVGEHIVVNLDTSEISEVQKI